MFNITQKLLFVKVSGIRGSSGVENLLHFCSWKAV